MLFFENIDVIYRFSSSIEARKKTQYLLIGPQKMAVNLSLNPECTICNQIKSNLVMLIFCCVRATNKT